jgi:DNA-binding NarL/FixJ family response regulator
VRPLIVIEGPRAAFASALADARHGGQDLIEAFVPRQGVVCCGEIADRKTAEQALLAAVGGAGLIVRATTSRDVTDRLLDDLRRLGKVDHRIDEPHRVTLTSEQRALLDLLSSGVTLGEAARRLRLSRRTADRRLAEARRALGVATTAEAVISHARGSR